MAIKNRPIRTRSYRNSHGDWHRSLTNSTTWFKATDEEFYGRSWRSTAMRASVAPRGATSGLGWMRCSRAWPAESSTSWPLGAVCRLGRSLSDLIGLLGELRSRDIDLYLHQQALDTSTPSGRMLFGMLGVFSEFERAMIRDRVLAGLDRARSSGKRLGRPRTTPFQVQRIRLALDEGRGVRETARLLKVSAAKVSEVRRMSAARIGLHP